MVLGDDQLGASDPGPGAFSSAGRPHLTPLPRKPVSIRARPQTFCVLGVKGWGWATPGRRPQCPAPSPGGVSGLRGPPSPAPHAATLPQPAQTLLKVELQWGPQTTGPPTLPGVGSVAISGADG